MKLNWRQPADAEDRLEAWVTQNHQRRVLAGDTTPIGPCPDESFLRDLARRSKKIDLSDPRIDHAATCPICMNQLLGFRRVIHLRRRTFAIASVVATCLIVGLIIGIGWHELQKRTGSTNVAIVSKAVDLSDSDALRGEERGQSPSITLPATLVRVTIILPRFSVPGQYLVAVTRDQNGNGVIAEGTAVAEASDGRKQISVTLDLHSAKPGAYYLSTTHEPDEATYYYPLQIR